eukprot:272330-Chlamydomonas_euryale.AAC.1
MSPPASSACNRLPCSRAVLACPLVRLQVDPEYAEHEKQYVAIVREILGEDDGDDSNGGVRQERGRGRQVLCACRRIGGAGIKDGGSDGRGGVKGGGGEECALCM